MSLMQGLIKGGQRKHDAKALEDFPTPPWMTRALCDIVDLRNQVVWEPAANRGLMVRALEEVEGITVLPSDIADYGMGYDVVDFLDPRNGGPDIDVDWIITNPPFNASMDFCLKALTLARRGVAFLCRMQWLESRIRYRMMYENLPPTHVAIFCERHGMVHGGFEMSLGSIVPYAWYVWDLQSSQTEATLRWVPPGTKNRLTKERDIEETQWNLLK